VDKPPNLAWRPIINLDDGGDSLGLAAGTFPVDVSDEIRLSDLSRLLDAPQRVRKPVFRESAPEYLHFASPPVLESLEDLKLHEEGWIGGQIAYYDYGAVSLTLDMPFKTSWQGLIALAARWMNDPELERNAGNVLRACLRRAAPALANPYEDMVSEDYFIVHLNTERFGDDAMPAADLIERHGKAIAQVVRGEAANFSAAEQAEILESRMSYYESDLVVTGWSAALVYDTPEGAAPTIQLLEYANTQLLAFRHYDAILTRVLAQVYRSLEHRGGLLARWRLANEAERVNAIRLDVREFTERVDNSLKFLSDMFAARLYRMAAIKIGVPDYRTLVDQKLQIAGELYASMMDRYYHGRAFILELMVVIILIIELAFLFGGLR
jgi:hypothetical protein